MGGRRDEQKASLGATCVCAQAGISEDAKNLPRFPPCILHGGLRRCRDAVMRISAEQDPTFDVHTASFQIGEVSFVNRITVSTSTERFYVSIWYSPVLGWRGSQLGEAFLRPHAHALRPLSRAASPVAAACAASGLRLWFATGGLPPWHLRSATSMSRVYTHHNIRGV